MKSYTAKIFSGTKLVADGITIQIDERNPEIAPSTWNGWFRAPTSTGITAGEYRVELSDGRSGNIRVSSASYGAKAGKSSTLRVQFSSNGPLK
jgi:hypothetical protein